MAIYKAIRTALGKAFLGDTFLAKALPLSSPDVFDDRLISFLDGLKVLNEPRVIPGPAIEGADIRAFFTALHATHNADRISKVAAAVALTGQFGTFQWVDHGALAMDAGGAGFNRAAYTDELRIARLGPKAWAIRAKALYSTGTTIVGGQHMRWGFDVSSSDPVYVAFLAALPTTGQVIGNRVWRAGDGTVRFGNVGIYKAASAPGLSGANSVYFDIARIEGSDYDSGIGYGDSIWETSSVDGRVSAQLNLSLSGVLIIP